MKSFLNITRIALPLLGIVVFAYLAVTIIKLDERLLIATAQTKQNAVFYDVSAFDTTIANPGELLRSERLYSTPNGIEGWRMLYRSFNDDRQVPN